MLGQCAQQMSGVGAVLALVPLGGGLRVLHLHMGHEEPFAHSLVVAQLAADGVGQALVNIQLGLSSGDKIALRALKFSAFVFFLVLIYVPGEATLGLCQVTAGATRQTLCHL